MPRPKFLKGEKNLAKNPEIKEKIRLYRLGRKHSEKTKNKIKIALTGRKLSEEHKKKLKEIKRGKRNKGNFEKGHLAWNKGKKLPTHALKMKGNKNGINAWFKRSLNNPNWQGGISFEPYSIDWTKTLKRSIRERDRYTCQICGKEPAICVHHIDYNKKNCNPKNLIILCKKCHTKTNYNRNYWKNLFNSGSD